ncbi:MAG: hypothetical protein JWO33_2175 [Caulobacteraceae bacterium]|jgi:hypothetical protein|nr:hypothetical protein [Caulobacteraceae bacterium]
MHRRTLLAVLPLLIVAGPAAASEEKKPAAAEVGQYVDLSPVGLPIIVRGQLVNYVFVYVRINLSSGANTGRWREREPYFRDALVRASHRTPFTLADDYQKIDVARLTATLTRDAAAITGPGVVRSVVVTSQAPRRRVPAPRPVAS